MGCVESNPAGSDLDPRIKAANSEITATMKTAERVTKHAKKLLLLGTGSSGKSTLFKSLKIITKEPHMETETAEARHVIRQNCVAGILTLLKKSQELWEKNEAKNIDCLVNMDQETVDHITNVVQYGSETFSEVLDHAEVASLGISIYFLWTLKAVKATFSRRGNTYSFPDNMDYFFNKVRAIMTETYNPSVEDMLKCRFVHFVRQANLIITTVCLAE